MTKSRGIYEMNGLTKLPERKVYDAMKRRCNNSNAHAYENYGGRGIKVCDRWLNSFANFIEDMGRRPTSRHTLERNDTNKSYSPENCRWATYEEQANNKRSSRLVVIDGRTQTLARWIKQRGIKQSTVSQRLKYGWTLRQALEFDVHPNIRRKHFV